MCACFSHIYTHRRAGIEKLTTTTTTNSKLTVTRNLIIKVVAIVAATAAAAPSRLIVSLMRSDVSNVSIQVYTINGASIARAFM